MLPTHYVVEPAAGRDRVLDGQRPPGEMPWAVGDTVILQNFADISRRPDGQSLALRGKAIPGHPSLRVHWRSLQNPHGATGTITATRWTKLRGIVQTFSLGGLPDPLEKLERSGRLVEHVVALGERLGFAVKDTATGGASDANTTSGMGVPTIDGLGPIGGNDHSPAEYLEVASIVPRTALFTALLLAVARDSVVRNWRG